MKIIKEGIKYQLTKEEKQAVNLVWKMLIEIDEGDYADIADDIDVKEEDIEYGIGIMIDLFDKMRH